MTAEEKLQEILRKRQLRQKQTRDAMVEMAGVGATGRTANRGFTDRRSYTAGGNVRTPERQLPGQRNVRRGYMPNDTEVSMYASMEGAGEEAWDLQQLKALQEAEAQAASASSSAAAGPDTSRSERLAELLADQKRKMEEFNAAGRLRYDQGLGEFTDLRDRNRERVKSFGDHRRRLNEERFSESLKDAKADLADRGLSGSTSFNALKARKERDLALVQDKVAEDADTRAIDFDTRDTGAITRWVESRKDTPPSEQTYLQLARELGQAQALEASDAQQASQAAQEAAAAQAQQGRYKGPSLNSMAPGMGVGYIGGSPAAQAQQMTGVSGFLGNAMSNSVTPTTNRRSQYYQQDARDRLLNRLLNAEQRRGVQYSAPPIGGGFDSGPIDGGLRYDGIGLTATQRRVAEDEARRQARIQARFNAGYQRGDARRAMRRKPRTRSEMIVDSEHKKWRRDNQIGL